MTQFQFSSKMVLHFWTLTSRYSFFFSSPFGFLSRCLFFLLLMPTICCQCQLHIVKGSKQCIGKGIQPLHEKSRELAATCAEEHEDRLLLGFFGCSIWRTLWEVRGKGKGSSIKTCIGVLLMLHSPFTHDLLAKPVNPHYSFFRPSFFLAGRILGFYAWACSFWLVGQSFTGTTFRWQVLILSWRILKNFSALPHWDIDGTDHNFC